MTKSFDYAAKKAELEEVLAWFDSPQASLSDSMAQFDRAKKLLDELSAYLEDIEAKVAIRVKSVQDSEQ